VLVLSAKVVKAVWLFSMGNKLYEHPQELGTLEWLSQNQDEEKNCQINFPPFDTREVSVSQYQGGVVFTYCHGPRKPVGHGVVLVKIRIDGTCAGRPIFPRYFQGYLHAFNAVDDRYNFASLKFREGVAWKNDPEIPLSVRNQEVVIYDQETKGRKKRSPH